MNDSRLALIIPAAGSGVRLGREIPKAYLKIADKTILEYTLRRFINIEGLSEVVVATSGRFVEQTKTILSEVFPNIAANVVLGGEERQHSIMNALNVVSGEIEYVAVHDAVRPFIDENSIRMCFDEARLSGGAIIAIPARDTIKISDGNTTVAKTPDREQLWQAQTPQIFRYEILVRAYNKAREEKFLGTDDSSLVEHLGEAVALVEGNRENFKITYPLDLKLAEWLITKQNG